MFPLNSRFVEVIVFLYLINGIVSKVELTNVKCTSLDKDFTDIDYCFLKSVNRSYKYVSIKVKLFKTPITKVKVNVEMLKRYNGYKPWLYNVTVDACRFLKYPKSNPFIAFVHGFFMNYSNMNHTCPFDHDLILEKLPVSFMNQRLTEVLPFPTGDYLFLSNWFAYDINRAKIASKVELTNVKCSSLDTNFTDIDYSFLKSINRSYKYDSIEVKLFKTPITKVKVNIEMIKPYNGYKLWLNNVTVDACRFLKYPKSNPFIAFVHGFFMNYSNMNHTCPFDHDLILERLPVSFMN